MSIRRRLYSVLGGWLMSGEVLYCGNPSVTSDSWTKITLSRAIDLDIEALIIQVITDVHDAGGTKFIGGGILSISCSNSGNQHQLPIIYKANTSLNMYIVYNEASTSIEFKYSYAAGFSATTILILAIPRTDV